MAGWILLHRSILKHWVWLSPLHTHRWLYILLNAAYEDRRIEFSNKSFILKRGQLLTTYRTLQAQWKTSSDVVSSFLKMLSHNNMINVEATKDYTLITVVNYNLYQSEIYSQYETGEDIGGEATLSVEKVASSPLISDEDNQSKPKRRTTQTKINKENSNKKKTKKTVVVSEPTHEQILEDFFNSQIAIEVFCKNESIDIETCKRLAHEVINDWVLRGESHESVKQGREHLLNQLRIKINIYKRQNTKDHHVQRQEAPGEEERGLASGTGQSAGSNPLSRATVHRADIPPGD